MLWPRFAWLLGGLPVAYQLLRLDHARRDVALAWLLATIATLTARALRRTWWWWLPLVGAVAIGSLALPLVPVGAEVLFGVAAAAWLLATGGVRPGTGVPVTQRVPAAVPSAVATVLLVTRTGVQVPLLLHAATAACVAILGLVHLRRGPAPGAAGHRLRRAADTNRRLLDRIGRPIGIAFGAVVMLPAAVVVMVGWLAHTVARHDPLGPPVADGTRWVRRSSTVSDPRRSFAHGPVFDPRGSGATMRRLSAAGLTLAIFAAIVLALPLERLSSDDLPLPGAADDGGCVAPTDDPVMSDQPGWAETYCESAAFVSRPQFDAMTTFVYPDADGEAVNVVDGERATWRPADLPDDPLTIWWFGGSAAWGWQHRDDFTIPSQLAKRADAEGMAIEVRNFAMPAWVLRQETTLLQALLESSEERPDLVVFYDGGNELNRQKERNGRGQGADERPTTFYEAELTDFLWNGPPRDGEQPWERPTPHPGGEVLTPEEVAGHAIDRYARDVARAREIAEEAGIASSFVWQPLMHSAPEEAGNRDGIPAVDDPIWERMVPAAVTQLPDGVIDLSDALDGVDRMVFNDFFHTNEHASDVVAAALLDELRPTLRTLDEGR
jgi:hypothetical protein